MISHLTAARWFVVLRRLAETIAATLPLFALLFIPLLFGLDSLYPWVRPPVAPETGLPGLIEKKRAYYNVPFFCIRAAIYFSVWIAVSLLLRRWSVRQDGLRGGGVELARKQRVLSAIALPAVAFTLTFAAFDWLMSLSAGWVSAVWGVYYFAGGFVAALGTLAVAAWAMQRAGALGEQLTASHFHALGKMLLAFVLFWAYIAYSQYLIVWIANLPAEVRWYLPRVGNGWGWLALLLAGGHLALPFAALLSWRVKRNPAALGAVGGWIVAMHYLDVYWMVLPALHPAAFRPHWLDVAALASVAGSTIGYAIWRLRAAAPFPAGDPYLRESLEYSHV